jgi:hypothetical protein
MSLTPPPPSRTGEAEAAGYDRRIPAREDRPCARCGHLRSAHAPPAYTRMYCDVTDCSCDIYFPAKSHEAMVHENIALQRHVVELEAKIEQLSRGQRTGFVPEAKADSAQCG